MTAKKPVEKKEPKKETPERTVKCGNCGAKHPFGTQTCDKCGYTRVSM